MLLQHTGMGIDRIKIGGLSLSLEQFLYAANLWGFRLLAVGCSEIEKRAGFKEVWAGFSRQIHALNAYYEITGSYYQTHKGLQIFTVSFKRNGQQQQLARFQLFRTQANTCTAAYEIHPPYLYRGELRTFDYEIIAIMGEHFSYRSFAEHGKVSCIELYTDLLNIPPDSFLIHKPGARKSCMFQGNEAITIDPATVDYSNPDDADLIELIEQHNITKPTTIPRTPGHRLTQYSCSRSSLFQAKSYCSKTRLLDTKRPDLYGKAPYRTRIELTLRKTGLSLEKLPTLGNQFERIRIYSIAKMQGIKGSEWTWFTKAAKKDGIAIALARYSEHARKTLRKQLENCHVDWAESLVKIWSSYPKCLEVIQPQYMLEMPTPQTTIQVPNDPPVSIEVVEADLALFKAIAAMQEMA